MTSYPFLNVAAATAKYYFRFRICLRHCIQKVKVYQQTKFRRYISIGGWGITTSGYEIQTSAILEFYFRFRSRPVRRNMHVILHQATEFCQNRATTAKFDVISLSEDGGRDGWILLPVSYLLKLLSSEGKSLLANQILWRYLHWRLRYNYFQFRKYKRPPYWNSTSDFDLDQFGAICMLLCIRLPNFVQIGATTAAIWRHIHFSTWRPQPLNTTSGFVFVYVTTFRKSKSISKPHFVDISPLAAKI